MEQQLVTLPIGGIVRDPYGGIYAIEALLGKRQSEAAYLVRDQYFKRHLYILREFFEPDERERVRLMHEGELLGQSDHGSSPRVYGVFENAERGRVYLLMDYIPNRGLEELRKVRPFSVISRITPRLPSTEPNLEAAMPTPAPTRRRAGGPKKREMLLFLALTFLVGAIIGISLFTFFLRSPHTTTTRPKPVPSPTLGRLATAYPGLATSYAGTVLDLLNSEKTSMYLTGVQQDQSKLSGSFRGLGLAGPFTGALTPSGQVQFSVRIKSNDLSLVFEGDIKIGGDIVGSFVVQNQQGDKTGESGIWNIAAVS